MSLSARLSYGITAVLLLVATMTSGFSLSMMSSPDPRGPPSGMSLIPDQGSRTTMNPYYQIPKFSAYPKSVEDRRAGRGLPSYQGTSLPSYTGGSNPAALPPASTSSSALARSTEPAPEDDPAKYFNPQPDQGRGTTMNPRYQINKFSTYPPHMNR